MVEQKNKSRARVRVAFFCVVGAHVVAILTALLAQGCKREPVPAAPETNAPPVVADTNLPVMDTNTAPAAIPSNVTTTVVPDATPPAQAQEYVVQKGDTFSTIAPKFHVSVKALQAANPTVVPTKLQPGHKLVIPAPPATAPSVTPAATDPAGAAATGEHVYTVKAGDNLTKIATQFGTTPNAIRKANSLATDRITVGQKLKIPGKSPGPAPGAAPAPTATTPPR